MERSYTFCSPPLTFGFVNSVQLPPRYFNRITIFSFKTILILKLQLPVSEYLTYLSYLQDHEMLLRLIDAIAGPGLVLACCFVCLGESFSISQQSGCFNHRSCCAIDNVPSATPPALRSRSRVESQHWPISLRQFITSFWKACGCRTYIRRTHGFCLFRGIATPLRRKEIPYRESLDEAYLRCIVLLFFNPWKREYTDRRPCFSTLALSLSSRTTTADIDTILIVFFIVANGAHQSWLYL